jgi:predicted transposase/invertase (TIGR01784 family)
MRSEIDPKVDYAFKRLFGSEQSQLLLADLLNAMLSLPLGKPVIDLKLANPFTEKDFVAEKVSVLDVRAEDQAGRRFNVEMEQRPLWVFRQRALYYWAELYSSQLFEGEEYWTLSPVYSVCFLDGTLFDDPEYHHSFRLIDPDHRNELLSKDLEIHLFELNKFNVAVEQIQNNRERWCYFLKHGASLDNEQLPPTMDRPLIRRALEILLMLNQNEIERQRYLSRRKAERDEATYRNIEGARKHAYEEGREEGLEEGLKEGLKEGHKEGHKEGLKEGHTEGLKEGLIRPIQLTQRLLKQAVTSKEELLRLSVEELTRLADQLEQQTLARQNGTAG